MDKIELLQSVPLFSDLHLSSLQHIADQMILRSYTKGQMILMEESLGGTFFIMAKGNVKVTRMSDDGREVILALLGEGEFFGEMSLLDGEGRSANVVAIEETQALTIKRGEFLAILEKYPKIAIHLLEELTHRLRRSDQQIESLSLSDAEQRISITLIRLAEQMGTIKEGAVTVRNLPYQQDIANMAGTSRETVSRMFKLLEEKGFIERKDKELIITNFALFCKTFS